MQMEQLMSAICCTSSRDEAGFAQGSGLWHSCRIPFAEHSADAQRHNCGADRHGNGGANLPLINFIRPALKERVCSWDW